MDKLDKLKKLLEIANTDTLTQKDAEKFLKLLIETYKKTKDDLASLSKENIAEINKAIDYIDKKYLSIEQTVSQETVSQGIRVSAEFADKMAELKKLITEFQKSKPKDGENANPEDVVPLVLELIPKPIEETGESIANKLETLKGESRLDASAIKNLPITNVGGGNISKAIYQLSDVVLSNLSNNDTLKWDDTNKYWVNGTGGGGGTWGSITGTLSDQTDLQSALDAKQATLVSGTNIKTINSESLLGSTNILLQTPLIADTDYLTPGTAASTYQPLDTQLTSLAGLSYSGNAGKFIRVNAGETGFELAAVTGSGTVTSVDMSVPTGLTISGNPITTTGTLALALDTGYVIPLQTTLDGFVTEDQTVGQTIGDTTNRLTKLWATDITVTNAITGSITGNAGTVTNGLYTTDIGTSVQAYDADLTTWAGITPGTGVGTALAVNVGSAGAFIVNGGALGTPSSGVATNLTGTASGLTAGAVTNATLTTALTVNTGTVTLKGNAANTSALTIGAGAVSVSGSNTGDQDLSGYLLKSGGTMTGNLLFTDNTYDIGASGATRPRTGYFGTSLVAPTVNATTGFQINGAATSNKILKANGTNFVASTETYAAPGTSGNVMTSDGTNWTSAAPAASGSATAIDSTQATWNNYILDFSGSGATPTGDTWDSSAMNAATRWNGKLFRATFGTDSYVSQFLPGNIGSSSAFLQFGNGKNIIISWNAKYSSASGQIGIGIADDTSVFPVIGTSAGKLMFTYNGTTLNAVNGGASNTTTDVSTGITRTNWNAYRIEYTYGTNVKFYINNTLVATHTTNLPTSSSNARFGIGGHTSGNTAEVADVVISVKQS